MLWNIYCLAHEAAKTIMGTIIMWPLIVEAPYRFIIWLAGG